MDWGDAPEHWLEITRAGGSVLSQGLRQQPGETARYASSLARGLVRTSCIQNVCTSFSIKDLITTTAQFHTCVLEESLNSGLHALLSPVTELRNRNA